MVMVNSKTLNSILQSKNFQTQKHKLANIQLISDNDAQNELLHQFLEVRCKNMSESEFINAWEDKGKYENGKKNNKYLCWLMTHSVKDITKQKKIDEQKNKEAKEYLKSNSITTCTIDDNSDNSQNEKLKELVLLNLEQLFHGSTRKKEFIKVLFTSGSKEAELYLKQHTKTPINSYIGVISKYCDKNRKRFNTVLNKELSNKDKKILSFIDSFLTIEHQNNVSLFIKQGQESELISKHKALFEDLIGTCGDIPSTHYITHQVSLLNHWEKIEYQKEKSYLIDYLEQKQKQLQKKLK